MLGSAIVREDLEREREFLGLRGRKGERIITNEYDRGREGRSDHKVKSCLAVCHPDIFAAFSYLLFFHFF